MESIKQLFGADYEASLKVILGPLDKAPIPNPKSDALDSILDILNGKGSQK
jgi:hypothetical protein